MSEPLPPLPPIPSEPPPSNGPGYEPPDFWVMFFLGVGLAVASGVACFGTQNVVPVLLASLAAFVSVFFRGWRGIFLGFLAMVGVAVLAVIVICGTMLSGMHNL